MTVPGASPPASVEGRWARLERVDPGDPTQAFELSRLDWLRTASPEMGGWFRRSTPRGDWSTALFRSLNTGEVVGVLDAAPLPGYLGVVSVSIFTDPEARAQACALDAYRMFVTILFDGGARLVHHEVLEHNRPALQTLGVIGLEPTARLREHGYAAGRLWDVLAFSYDRVQWVDIVARAASRWPRSFPLGVE